MIKSSYDNNNLSYKDIFRLIVFFTNPKKIVEFGILDGFSLNIFLHYTNNNCLIEAYDIFEKFNGNHCKRNIVNKFNNYKNLIIKEGDYFKIVDNFENESIDILHIDIANDGDVYKFAIENYLKKIKNGGVILLEGGSEERDNIEWMKKYNKKSIKDFLNTINEKYIIIEKFPSLTIIKKFN